jgi:hypothetical protein
MNEIRGSTRAEHSGIAGRARRVEADERDIAQRDAGTGDRHVEAVGNLLQADLWTLFGTRRMLTEAVDEPLLVAVEKRIVDGGAPKIDSGNDAHKIPLKRPLPRGVETIAERLPSGEPQPVR